ncbi:MAG: glycosyltransferase [Elusimicrobiales bacterium]|nr:glycosyltransferase [Elusimicrobiales bacterium]
MPETRIPLLYVIENERYGGGERAFAQLINGLNRERYAIHAACLTGVPGSEAFTGEISGAARVIHLDLRRLVSPGAVLSLRRIIKDNGIKIVHSQGPRADFYARLAASLTGARVVSTVASPVEEYDVSPVRKTLYSVLDGMSSGACDRFVAVARHIERKLLQKKVPASKIVLVYNGIETWKVPAGGDTSAEVRSRYGVGREEVMVCACSRLSAEKGLFTLLDALAEARSSGLALKCVIAGEGPLRAALEERAGKLGLAGQVLFTGFLRDVSPLLAASDAFLLPSLREGLPIGLLEAMAMGKPVIASDIEGVNEVVEGGRNGLLVPSGGVAELAAALRWVIIDRPRAAEMGKKAQADISDRFGVAAMLAGHDRIYSELAED